MAKEDLRGKSPKKSRARKSKSRVKAKSGFKTNSWAGFKHVRARNEVGNKTPNYYNAKQVQGRHSGGEWSQTPQASIKSNTDVTHTKKTTGPAKYNPWELHKAVQPSKPGDFYVEKIERRSGGKTTTVTTNVYGKDNTAFHHKSRTVKSDTQNLMDERSVKTTELGSSFQYHKSYDKWFTTQGINPPTAAQRASAVNQAAFQKFIDPKGKYAGNKTAYGYQAIQPKGWKG